MCICIHTQLVFIYQGSPAQLACGAMICFLFLLLNIGFAPYCTDGRVKHSCTFQTHTCNNHLCARARVRIWGTQPRSCVRSMKICARC